MSAEQEPDDLLDAVSIVNRLVLHKRSDPGFESVGRVHKPSEIALNQHTTSLTAT